MRKVLALVLATALAFGMSTMAFAADNKITGFVSNDALEQSYARNPAIGASFNSMTGNSVSNQTVSYKSSIVPHDKTKDYIDLYRGMFNWNNAGLPNTRLTATEIRNSNLVVRTSVRSGSKAIDSVDIDKKNGCIEIKYVEEYVSVKDLDFDFTVYLTVDGKRFTDAGLTFVGTLANDVIEVYAGDEYVDTSYGQIAYAQDFVKDIQVDLGNGVSIYTKMFKEKKYYGTSTRDADEADDVVFSKYADIDNVVTLNTVGLNGTGNIVRLDTDYSEYYVYDKDLNYLGRSNKLLPYSTKYYLANKALNVAEAEVEEEGEAAEGETPEPEDEAAEGKYPKLEGGSTDPNPDTGANGFINAAIIAAIVSLAAAGAIALKKK